MQPSDPLQRIERRISGPDAEVIEYRSSEGHTYTGLVYAPKHLAHERLSESVGLVWSFLSAPMVPGLTPLEAWDQDNGIFYYPTGPIWTAQELFAWIPRRTGEPYFRAGLELVAKVAQILVEAAEVGHYDGIAAHGGLNPTRVAIDLRGDVQVIGYGLPQISVLKYAAGEGPAPVDAIRYSPPERFDVLEEDILSDLYSLALIGIEWMIGEPVYPGNVSKVLGHAIRGQGAACLHRFQDELPMDILQVFGRAMNPDRDTRYRDGHAFLDAVEDLLQSPIAEGPTLESLMGTAIRKWSRCRLLVPNENPATTTVPVRPFTHQPSLLPTTSMSGPTTYYRVETDQTPHEIALSPDESLALSAARWIQEGGAIPMDMRGQLTGWYRIVQDDTSWFGHTETQVLDATKPIRLEFVENETQVARFQLHTQSGIEEFEMTVGLATTIQFILAELRHRHSLTESDWSLWINDVELDPWQILDDYAPVLHLQLILRRRESE